MIIKVGATKSEIVPEPSDWERSRNWIKNLKQDFTVKMQNAYWATKGTEWDGRIRLIDYKNKFRTGLIPSIMRWGKRHKHRVKIEKYKGFTYSNLVTELEGNKLKPWQEEMLGKCLKWRRGIINAATNSGKSFVFPFLVESYNKPKTLILTNRVNVFAAISENFSDVGTIDANGFNTGHITIGMQQSLVKKCTNVNALKWLKTVELLIVDECHWASGKKYMKLIDSVGAYHRFFFSGTPLDDKSDLEAANLIGMSGPVIYQVSNQEMIKAGQSRSPVVHILKNKCANIKRYADSLRQNIKESRSRAELIRPLLDKKCLVFTQWTQHAELMSEVLGIDYCHGKDPDRTEKLKRFQSDPDCSLITTMIISEGSNLFGIDRIIWAGAGKSSRMVNQTIGRALRKMDEKDKMFEVYDFMDDDGGPQRKHSLKRIGIYNSQKYKVIE